MPLGWFDDLSDANDYFVTERPDKSSWDELTDDAKKEATIKMAYNRLYYHPDYSIPTYADATATQLVKLKIINGEMAYYLAMHLADEDRRKGLQAQAVTAAGIVKETYDRDKLDDVPIPPIVHEMLKDAGFTTAVSFGMIDIDRDEDESVDTKVDDF